MTPEHAAWLAKVTEDPLEPDLAICDPHHHLWDFPTERYLVTELHADTGAGHRVERTVYVDCGSGYRTDGPEHLRPVGEIEFAADMADRSVAEGGAEIAGIVGHADMRLGGAVEEVLAAQVDAGRGRFRGIRHATSHDDDPKIHGNHVRTPPGAMGTPEFRAGMAVLGRMNLSFDAWLYHPQIGELVDAARAVPEVTIVLDHLGGPLGIGPYQRDQERDRWRRSMAAASSCPNVHLKVGGIGMPSFGIAWHKRPSPPTSVELADAWRDDIEFCIEAFGPTRCMFESNFPVDRKGCSYTVLWNAFKRIAAGHSAEDKRWLFHDTAATAYQLTTSG